MPPKKENNNRKKELLQACSGRIYEVPSADEAKVPKEKTDQILMGIGRHLEGRGGGKGEVRRMREGRGGWLSRGPGKPQGARSAEGIWGVPVLKSTPHWVLHEAAEIVQGTRGGGRRIGACGAHTNATWGWRFRMGGWLVFCGICARMAHTDCTK